jgi:hypothetical protein
MPDSLQALQGAEAQQQLPGTEPQRSQLAAGLQRAAVAARELASEHEAASLLLAAPGHGTEGAGSAAALTQCDPGTPGGGSAGSGAAGWAEERRLLKAVCKLALAVTMDQVGGEATGGRGGTAPGGSVCVRFFSGP